MSFDISLCLTIDLSNLKSGKCVTNSYRPLYHSLSSCAFSPQLQYILLLGEGATLMAKVNTHRQHILKYTFFLSILKFTQIKMFTMKVRFSSEGKLFSIDVSWELIEESEFVIFFKV